MRNIFCRPMPFYILGQSLSTARVTKKIRIKSVCQGCFNGRCLELLTLNSQGFLFMPNSKKVILQHNKTKIVQQG